MSNPSKRVGSPTTCQKQCHLTNFCGNGPSSQGVQLAYSALASSRFSILKSVVCHSGLYEPRTDWVDSYTSTCKLICSGLGQRIYCCLGRGVCGNTVNARIMYRTGQILQSTVPAPERRPATETQSYMSLYEEGNWYKPDAVRMMLPPLSSLPREGLVLIIHGWAYLIAKKHLQGHMSKYSREWYG